MIATTRIAPIAFILVSLACDRHDNAGAQTSDPPHGPRETSTVLSTTSRSSSLPPIPHVPTPDTLRGLYVNRWAALGSKLTRLIDVAKKTEINALVIDVKDDRGFVLYRSGVALAREIGADTADGHWMSPSKLRAVLDTMIANGIYPIARIVVAKDPLLART